MQKILNTKIIRNKIALEISSHKIVYVLLLILLVSATLLRIYRTDSILGFYFDQGRDALVVAELLNQGKLFLIGPTTGIAGIFRGPFYYYLIAPAYLIGGGDPVFPAIFLALSSVVALVVLYKLGLMLADRTTGLLAVFLGGFSYYTIYASRWLSNPTPMLVLSTLILFCLFKITEGKYKYLPPISFLAGISLFHFGSSGEVFLIFSIALVTLSTIFLQKKVPSLQIIASCAILFMLTALPLVIFDLRHGGILSKNIQEFLFAKDSFSAATSNTSEFFIKRADFLFDVFYSKFFLGDRKLPLSLFLIAASSFVLLFLKNLRNRKLLSLVIVLLIAVIGFFLFRGNEGNVYDYYLTVYYLPFTLLFAYTLRNMAKNIIGSTIVLAICVIFLQRNLVPTSSWLSDGLDGPTTIAFGNQKKAVEWVYGKADGKEFNTDFYVPPVIPHSWNYLFQWYESKNEFFGNSSDRKDLLFTIHEVDPPHPERLEAWMKRQEGIGKVIEEKRFGGITAQMRQRI